MDDDVGAELERLAEIRSGNGAVDGERDAMLVGNFGETPNIDDIAGRIAEFAEHGLTALAEEPARRPRNRRLRPSVPRCPAVGRSPFRSSMTLSDFLKGRPSGVQQVAETGWFPARAALVQGRQDSRPLNGTDNVQLSRNQNPITLQRGYCPTVGWLYAPASGRGCVCPS